MGLLSRGHIFLTTLSSVLSGAALRVLRLNSFAFTLARNATSKSKTIVFINYIY